MATMNTCSSLLVVVAMATAVVCAFAPLPATADCPWMTLSHSEDHFIQSLGKWALIQVDQQAGLILLFDKVESAKVQFVGQCTTLISRNTNYELIIDASYRPNSQDDKYRAVVYVTNFTQPHELISFNRVIRRRPLPANGPTEAAAPL